MTGFVARVAVGDTFTSFDIPAKSETRNEAYVHFGTGDLDRQSHASILSAWLKVPLTWYQSVTVAQFPGEEPAHIARTFTPTHEPSSQRKFCGFCGTHVSYWTEEPVTEQNFMNITLGSLRERDLLALEDLELLPRDVDLAQAGIEGPTALPGEAQDLSTAVSPAGSAARQGDVAHHSRSGTSGGLRWFEEMIQGSQLGLHSKRRMGHGTSADGTTSVSWEVTEYYDSAEEEAQQTPLSTKRKAGDIEGDDTSMQG